MNGDIGHSIGQQTEPLKDRGNVSVKDNFSVKTDAFLIDDISAFSILRTEKLASAVYLVSGLLSDSEPIKWGIRKLVTDILSDTGDLVSKRESNYKGQMCPIENISSKIFQITSMFKVAWMGGLVSKMNYEILISEYLKLNDFLVKNFRVSDEQKQTIKESFFASGEISSLEEKIKNRKLEEKYLGEEFLSTDIALEGIGEQVYARRNFIKDISSKGHLSDKKDFVLKNSPVVSVAKTRTLSEIVSGSVSDRNKKDRQDKILSAMSPGISYSVSEIISVVGKSEDTSEKTIQRDLQQLVSIGHLKKTGERRWSRYSLS